MKKVFTVSSVIGLIIVVIFVALEFTGVINFIDYRPWLFIESLEFAKSRFVPENAHYFWNYAGIY